ncbi:FPP/GGPP synthase family protein [Aspergillus ibericus CBS 121593]|uniref:Farnesyl pyrophosphate synthetase n=1 Tax=Aspergillus ibericus CBS 121593 TaxID=1448316 RepID=A0A395GSV9_9EURO|nr:farnesyl pyrophosphate synthetase [Aspergillus ibericus CBS 121593]RAK98472.1 farnesyl pyrophosphate synthetase [Aspergillus ibericus CBS 121593]
MPMEMDRERFAAMFPAVLEDALSYARSIHTPPEALAWLQKNITHNTTSGKHLRGLLIPNTHAHSLSRPLTSPEYTLSAKLGWLLELLQASFLIPDDIEDHDTVRRGKASWHAVPGVGMKAINDAALLQSIVFYLLRRYLKGTCRWYVQIVELLHEVVFRIGLGLNGISEGRCEVIARMKTAYYTIYAPVVVGMYLGGVGTEENLERMRRIALRLGIYYQESGRDIKDGKCSWLIVEALGRVNNVQRGVLECYGSGEPGAVERVQAVFREVGMKRVFEEFEEEFIERMRRDVADIDKSTGLEKGIFVDIMGIMYRRDK